MDQIVCILISDMQFKDNKLLREESNEANVHTCSRPAGDNRASRNRNP